MASKGNKRQELSHRQRLAALLISAGLNQAEAARMVGILPQQITRWKKDEVFREYLEKKIAEVEQRVEQARDILIEAAPLAALKMLGLLESEDETVLRQVAGDILDRVGVSKTTKIEGEVGVQLPEVVEIRIREDGGRSSPGPDSDTGE